MKRNLSHFKSLFLLKRRNTSIKGRDSEGERIPRGGEKILQKGEKEGYNAPRTLSEDLNPTTRINGKLS